MSFDNTISINLEKMEKKKEQSYVPAFFYSLTDIIPIKFFAIFFFLSNSPFWPEVDIELQNQIYDVTT